MSIIKMMAIAKWRHFEDRLICGLIERIPHMDSYLETKVTFPNR